MKNIDKVLEELNIIFINVFKDDSLKISFNTSADDIQAWDSFSNIELILDIENRFEIRFDLRELANIKNVGQLAKYILDKQG